MNIQTKPQLGLFGEDFDATPPTPAPPKEEWEYYMVEVSREQISAVYLKVPKNTDLQGDRAKFRECVELAVEETLGDYDWDDDDIEIDNVKKIEEKKTLGYECLQYHKLPIKKLSTAPTLKG